jgi:hypothetical protein
MSLTKAQLTKAAKMKFDGATWNAVREAMGVKYSSGKFQKLMDAAGIDRPATRPSGRGKAKSQAEAGSQEGSRQGQGEARSEGEGGQTGSEGGQMSDPGTRRRGRSPLPASGETATTSFVCA